MMQPDQRLAHKKAAVAFYVRALSGSWPEQYQKLLPPIHDDQLWAQLTAYLCGCGFASVLTQPGILHDVRSVAPQKFTDALQKRARADALRELSHRETLQRLHDALTQTGKRAILLKGAALYMLERSVHRQPARIPGDIDIWLESPREAFAFRAHLLDTGFTGDKHTPQTAPHHLAPVTCRHSAVEIHTAPMPAFWGLPSQDFAQRATPIPGWPCYQALSPTDMVLHEAVHCTSHLWSFGMKLAWDLQRISRLPGEIHWSTLPGFAHKTDFPMAFWAPVLALTGALPPHTLPMPPDFITSVQSSTKYQKTQRLASARTFTATDNAEALNPFLRNILFLSLMSWPKRASYLTYLFSPEASESRRTALSASGGQSWRQLPRHISKAWQQWRGMR